MWNIIEDEQGNQQLLPVEDQVPAGWTVIGQTVDPSWLTPPPTPRTITKYEARQRFTFTERGDIDTSIDVGVIVFRNDFNSATDIDLDNQEFIDGLAYLESIGLLASGRAAEIRA